MRWLTLLILLAACEDKQPAAEAIAQVAHAGEAQLASLATADAAASLPPPVLVAPPGEPEAGSRPRLALNLRSTPTGAAISLDGRLVGKAPLRIQVVDDGRLHDFAFSLAGHEPWKLRFAPVKDGVIHATLRPVPGEPPDAGVSR